MLRPLLLLACLLLSGCTLQSMPPQSATARVNGASPPRDFWIGVTVTGPMRETSTAYDALPRAMRPGRYVVEADRILRAAMGPGAKDDTFPPPTRRLSAAEFTELYNNAIEAGLLDPDHPFTVRTVPTTPPVDFNSPGTIDRTTFIITTHAAEKRHTIVMEASPQGSEESRKAARVIDWLANKAWVAPSTPARVP